MINLITDDQIILNTLKKHVNNARQIQLKCDSSGT